MGCRTSNQGNRSNIVSMLVSDNTNQIIIWLTSNAHTININQPLNIRGDTLLHYAVKRSNFQLVAYLVTQQPVNKYTKNILGKIPAELAEDINIKRLVL